ncbi:hypothetical protein BU26DRAFT_65235 [Trematosphaeria pertusa]|uniref:Uncharacterized protein n=1 Tax=Trematosphaeria pertusa TaxID=390896 RepID=A0A6A6I7H8_9PLEO|nr:uncharacterized protein BU26DRAFT_65235 [Trematosphaeria pertusa]KAF2246257.1 hypothetical protein BU26DRAFT_65235 [Trematosphaeria pertusa]
MTFLARYIISTSPYINKGRKTSNETMNSHIDLHATTQDIKTPPGSEVGRGTKDSANEKPQQHESTKDGGDKPKEETLKKEHQSKDEDADHGKKTGSREGKA